MIIITHTWIKTTSPVGYKITNFNKPVTSYHWVIRICFYLFYILKTSKNASIWEASSVISARENILYILLAIRCNAFWYHFYMPTIILRRIAYGITNLVSPRRLLRLVFLSQALDLKVFSKVEKVRHIHLAVGVP